MMGVVMLLTGISMELPISLGGRHIPHSTLCFKVVDVTHSDGGNRKLTAETPLTLVKMIVLSCVYTCVGLCLHY